MSLAEELKEALANLPQVRLAALFGSQARGTAGARSDLDVAVRLCPGDVTARCEVAEALERAARAEVDLVQLDDAPPLLALEIARDGVLLVEREVGAWASFRAHAMITWFDEAPVIRRMHRAALERLRAQVAAAEGGRGR